MGAPDVLSRSQGCPSRSKCLCKSTNAKEKGLWRAKSRVCKWIAPWSCFPAHGRWGDILDGGASHACQWKKSEAAQWTTSVTNLTYLPVQECLYWRIYSQNWPLLMLPPRFWGRSGRDYVPELQVCSIRVEVFRLFPGTCTLQGVLPKVTSAAPFP